MIEVSGGSKQDRAGDMSRCRNPEVVLSHSDSDRVTECVYRNIGFQYLRFMDMDTLEGGKQKTQLVHSRVGPSRTERQESEFPPRLHN